MNENLSFLLFSILLITALFVIKNIKKNKDYYQEIFQNNDLPKVAKNKQTNAYKFEIILTLIFSFVLIIIIFFAFKHPIKYDRKEVNVLNTENNAKKGEREEEEEEDNDDGSDFDYEKPDYITPEIYSSDKPINKIICCIYKPKETNQTIKNKIKKFLKKKDGKKHLNDLKNLLDKRQECLTNISIIHQMEQRGLKVDGYSKYQQKQCMDRIYGTGIGLNRRILESKMGSFALDIYEKYNDKDKESSEKQNPKSSKATKKQ